MDGNKMPTLKKVKSPRFLSVTLLLPRRTNREMNRRISSFLPPVSLVCFKL